LRKLKQELLLGDVVMGSSQSQLTLYERYGINPEAIVQCPLFFDAERLKNLKSKTGDYFVYYGQTRMEKGGHLLKEIISNTPDLKLIIPFNTDDAASNAITKFDLGEMISSGRIEIRTGLTWYEGAGKLVAESRGVLIPSVWPTTTEYVLLESLGLGKAVVAFDVGIHKDLIVSGKNGLLAPLGDTEKIALNMVKLASDDNLAAEIRSGARILFNEMTDANHYRVAFLSALEKAK
jgi:glycosyltransferase involved in cell wall biosynthesis